MQEFSILEELENTSSSKKKKEILKKNNTNPLLSDLLHAALNKRRKFYVKKFEVHTGEATVAPWHNPFDEFKELLGILENRVKTGHDALALISEFFKSCDEQERKWFSRVLKKDLRSGFTVNTAIKAGFNIPKFEVQLATDAKKCKKFIDLVKAGVSVSPKLDGYRCLAEIDNGVVTLYTRNGETFVNFPTVEASLSKLFPSSSFVFDGEIMSTDFNNTQKSAFASKRGTTVGDVVFNIFDMIPAKEWNTGNFTTKAFARYGYLEATMNALAASMPDNIKTVEREFTTEVDRVMELQAQHEGLGYEGGMLNSDIPYYIGKKSNRMLKVKTMLSQDCTVTGMYEGKNKYEGMMGGFVVTQENGASCEVGTGFSDEDREYMWNNKADVVGRLIEVKFQELTDKDQRMRFPVFMRWRDQGKDKI